MPSFKRTAQNFWLQLGAIVALAMLIVAMLTIIPSLGAQADASDFAPDPSQADALADGVVTLDEYTSAVDRTLSCVRDSGGAVIGLRFEDYRNVPVWNFVISNSEEVTPVGVSPYDRCWMVFSRDIEFAWGVQEQAKVTSETKAADEQEALECAVEEGLRVSTVNELRGLAVEGEYPDRGDPFRCLEIAIHGYDPADHPPIVVE